MKEPRLGGVLSCKHRDVVDKSLGEFALRVNDLDKMRAFYEDVVGLELLNDKIPGAVFLKVADAVEGHPQFLALFDRSVEVGPERTTLDHFAFLIDLKDYEGEKKRLEGLGIGVFPKVFPEPRWRALFFTDPEGNTVEFVCYDPDVESSP
jgi:catechol-2,3-dioxygenase